MGNWPALAVSLIGLVLLTESDWSNGLSGANDLWIILSFLGAVIGGAAIVCIKQLRATDSSVSIFMSQCLIGFWIVVVPANLVSAPVHFGIILILIGVGVLSTVSQLLMTWSFAYLPISTGSLLSLLTPICNVILGVILFKESLSLSEIIGTVLILSACLVVAALGKEPIAARR